jgi:hypothetical protein
MLRTPNPSLPENQTDAGETLLEALHADPRGSGSHMAGGLAGVRRSTAAIVCTAINNDEVSSERLGQLTTPSR